ncbi:hypothetical protein Tfer_2691 [Thermincola ferriacetica]|uniref:DUF4829 domain-containing protein n=1 Tax=Thermincola ferriacetica TaxID=281456 RepID=A0A0L6VZX3_9FIRM|nr:DUF4829 domain-containing protein [Thermincola ferriacetica]KNZ68698.1 hypothetical protein Tfer_2691 [Thermincola ferriacetica]
MRRKLKLWAYLGIVLLCLSGLIGCSTNNKASSDEALKVLEKHLRAIGEHNFKAYQETLSSRLQKRGEPDWGNIASVKLLSADESKATMQKEDYLQRVGRWTDPKDVKIYYVVQEIEKYREHLGAGQTAQPKWNYVLIRETDDGPWVIDYWGE